MKIFRWWPLLFVSCSWAQNDIQANVNLQFRFANPGARAQAMGGAFIGLANDTTAIFANPAGLVQLTSVTGVLEGNSTDRDNNIPFYSGTIRQVGLQDFTFDLESRDFGKRTTHVPFAAYVNPKSKVKWGVFLAEQANFSRDFTTNGIAIPGYADRYVERFELEFFTPSTNTVDLTMRTLGFSLAGNLSERISAGITLGYSQMEYQTQSILNFPDLEAFFPEVRFSNSQLQVLRPLYGTVFVDASAEGEDEGLSVFAGLHFRPTQRFSLGISYKRQPKFDYNYIGFGWDDNLVLTEQLRGANQFDVPDSYGAGFSFKPTDTATISLEVNRVLYSQLSDTFQQLFISANDVRQLSQTVADATEYHLGMEYIFLGAAQPISFRCGYWFEPYHALVNESLDTQLLFGYINEGGDFVQDSRNAPFLRQFARDLNHLTLGVGFTFSNNLILDIAGDIDEENTSLSLSSIYRF